MTTTTRTLPISKSALSGHFRRAQSRITEAFEGDEPNDVIMQAGISAVAASVGLRLLRNTPIGTLAAKAAPFVVFAAICQAALRRRR